MTEEDIKYRQGRSRKKVKQSEDLTMLSFLGVIVMIILLIIFK